ncbi:UvrD-helicase domain-containing protein [Winogradskyella echinorum]|uniref:DNA 3'-5' helicase n=1 Tax=Winogradskyella echinorum TaxID=538189 RepID=A0ABR6XZD5_9FLAO|nr:UvrD-helicase domain-containing protein [Winogradskyella echinorum]MBC3845852.1 UvrD-helicase domain-containing protein [Winogradskyella echinorum]MBC5750200.1 UvrD-helicase domain-containing protein [Winogradskyella echinorum]
MHNSPYKIYNASAGSGKTFTLAKAYLKILVQSKNYDEFKSILAITFTNKAVGEMKARIIDMLKSFSSEKSLQQPHPMFVAICDELSIEPIFLHNKSKHILKHIIHNYGAFDISTIDGFTHRVIRTFAHDLNLPVNFEVELDQERLLNEAVDSLIAKAGNDNTLTKVLIDFAIEKADDDKSWDISYDFNKIAKLLVNENDLFAIETLKGKTLQDFKLLKEKLIKQILQLETHIVKAAQASLTLIEECGLQFDDFNRSSLPNHFQKLSDKQFSVGFEAAWQNDLKEGNTIYPKRVTETIASTIESIQPTLTEAFTKTKRLIFELKLKKEFYKNITPLSVLNAIQNELNAIKDEQNKMLISEFNKIISNEIKDQPTPFIYERLGEKFKHYFIDEFQDTSKMQWENLVPLLDNALSAANGSTMLVGDAKQAIYRWRGGEAEQFINLYNETVNPFQVEAEVVPLNTNYRSAKEIIAFNNSFFKFLSERYFSNAQYADLYKHAGQIPFSNLDGFVNLNFLDITKEDDATELYALEVLKTINQCVANGFALDDVCVLVRKRKEGVALANYLSDQGIKITSSETLLLKNSDKINFVSSFLKLLLQPNNDSLKVEVLSYIAEEYHIKDKHQFFTLYLKNSLDDMFEELKQLQIFINKDELLQLPLYELVEHIIRTFKLNEKSDAYLQFYMDEVLEFSQKQHSDLAAFVSYFDKKQDKLSVVSPENMKAVKIMTIHKSKGLEFPVVIFPFADLNIYKELEPKVWFPVIGEEYCGFDTLLLNYGKDVEHYGEIGNEIYQTHQSQLELDNINLLYVVLTRAVEHLHIISKKDISSKGVVSENTYAGMFISYLQQQNKWNDNQLNYSFGKLNLKQSNLEKESASKALKFISVPKEDHNLSIITKAGLLWDTKQEKAIERGNLVHLVLSKIKTIDNLDFAFNDLLVSGEITKDNKDDLETLVANVVEHPKLAVYYQDNFKIYNERDIITSSGQLLRPDRLNINSKHEAIIIDYKTGEQKAFHKTQLNDYETVLTQMNLTVTHKLLVYINDTIDVIEV